MNLGFIILYLPNPMLRLSALPLVSHLGRVSPRIRLCTGALGHWRPYCRRQLLANAAIAASRVRRFLLTRLFLLSPPEQVIQGGVDSPLVNVAP
jgi:hypothetical protein